MTLCGTVLGTRGYISEHETQNSSFCGSYILEREIDNKQVNKEIYDIPSGDEFYKEKQKKIRE